MLRHIDSRDVDTARYSRNTLLLASTLIVGAAIVPGGFGSLAELQQGPVPPSPAVTVSLGQELEPVRSVPVGGAERSSGPEARVEAFTEAWVAGNRVAARRRAAPGTYRDLTRLANRYAIAEESTGHASAVCSPGPDIFCRVFLPGMLEVDARLARRHGEFVVLGFKLPTAG